MDGQQQYDGAVTIDRADPQMTETSSQLLLQADIAEQRLEHHQPGERGQSLILKLDLGNAVGFTMNGSFAKLHGDGLFWFCLWIGVHQFYQVRGRFFYGRKLYSCISFLHVLDLTMGEVQQQSQHMR